MGLSGRVILSVLILVIIAASTLTYGFVFPLSRTDTTVPTQDAFESEGNRYVPVGAFLYEWYGYNVTSGKWTGGLGTSHWNDTYDDVIGSGPIINVVKDTPDVTIDGTHFYPSLNNYTLAWQLSKMSEAGISVIIVSWWGVGNESGGGNNAKLDAAINNATLNLFRYVESTKNLWNFKIAIMIEPFNNQTTEPLSNTDWTNLYNYIESTFFRPFNDIAFYWQGKPLLLGFNPQYPPSIPVASIFTVRSEGGVPNPVNWYFWEGGNYLDVSGTKAQPQNYEYAPGTSPDGEVGVIWRYDDYYQRPTSYMRFDVNGSQGMYNYEWNYAIQHKAEVNLVLLYSWNEYHERSELEPHYDFTVGGNVSGVRITSYYVKIFENTSGVPPPQPHRTPTNSAYYIAAIVVVFAAVLFSLLFLLFRRMHDKLLSVKPPVKRVMSNTGLVETPVPAVRAAPLGSESTQSGKLPHPLILGIVSCGTIVFVYLAELVSSITGPWPTATENFLVSIGLPVLLLATAGNSLVAYAIAKHRYGNGKGIESYAAGTIAGVVIVGFVFAVLFVLALLFSIAASGGQ